MIWYIRESSLYRMVAFARVYPESDPSACTELITPWAVASSAAPPHQNPRVVGTEDPVMQPARFRLPFFLLSRGIGLLAVLAATSAAAAEPPVNFAGLWEDCTSVPGACYGYRLVQDGARVCGSLSRAALAGDAPRKHGHIRGVVRDGLLTQVSVCGVESRSPCPTVLISNRRGLLRCGNEMVETGGRGYTCAEWAAQQLPSQYQRVSAEAFNQRFGPAEPSLCEVPATAERDAPPAVKQ